MVDVSNVRYTRELKEMEGSAAPMHATRTLKYFFKMEPVNIVQCIRVLKMVVRRAELTHVAHLKSQVQMDDANAVQVARHGAIHIPAMLFDVDQTRY